jgi:hypothetical protein
MTDPAVVQELFLTTLTNTCASLGHFVGGTIRLVFLFPAMATVLATEFFVWCDTHLCRDPRPALLPVSFPRKKGA